MKKLKFIAKNGKLLSITVADNFWRRFCGLMLTSPQPANKALLLEPCNSIHMMFMRYSLDIVYLDKQNRVLKIVTNLSPWVGLSCCFKAHKVLEMSAGMAVEYGIKVNDVLIMSNE